MKKIKITKLAKTEEYISKEFNSVISFQKSLLSDTDWTQIYDSGLTTVSILAWRLWRFEVRSVHVTIEDYDAQQLILQKLKSSMPNVSKYISPQKDYPFIMFESSTPLHVLNQCVKLLEILEIKQNDIENFYNDIVTLDNDIILTELDKLLNGYRY